MRRVGLLLATLAAAACGSPLGTPSPVVDGWPVGAVHECVPTDRCPALLDVAWARLDAREPGHPAVERVAVHDEGAVFDQDGDRILSVRSGQCCLVVVFELVDGSVRAVGAGFPGIAEEPIALDAP